MIDEFDFGLYYSLIEDERFRDHYLDNNDNFYTQFLFHEGLTEYQSIRADVDKNNQWYVWWDITMKYSIDYFPIKMEWLLSKPNVEFNLIINWQDEEYVFERVGNSKIFKRKYLIDE